MAKVPLISQHESWISIDPIQGCPAKCVYCYLGPLDLYLSRPQLIESSASAVYEKLLSHPHFQKNILGIQVPISPICIGNYTDMLLTNANKRFLCSMLQKHQELIPETPVCVITKGQLDREFLSEINALNIKIFLGISISFFSHNTIFERGMPSEDIRLLNFELARQYSNLFPFHFWRPITSLNLTKANIGTLMSRISDAGATGSIITGLKFGDSLKEAFQNPNNPLSEYFSYHQMGDNQSEIFEDSLKDAIIVQAKAIGYPIFFHTSCLISYLIKQPDYNGTFRLPHLKNKCLASNCPDEQRARCFDFKSQFKSPTKSLLENIASHIDLELSKIEYSENLEAIIIDAELSQDQQAFLTHATSFPIKVQKTTSTIEWFGSINIS